jgi:hypothetical protein
VFHHNYIFDLEVPLSDSIRLTWCALSRFHALNDAELNLKKILFCDIANKNEILEKLKIRKASPLIIAE